jgi:DNA-binding Xre family transcriptional regulator
MNNETWRTRLAAALKEKITKVELARRLDLDKASVTRMLRGNANLTVRSIGELCWAMGVRPDFIVRDDPQPAEHANLPRVHVMPAVVNSARSQNRFQVTAQ